MTQATARRDLPWLIYGATGVTGRLVVAEAFARGQRPILAGRDAARLREVAEPLGLEWMALPLDRRAELEALLRRSSRVLLAAGPFGKTTRPMLDACLATGTPYVDVSGELDVVTATLARDAAAKQAGIAIVAGAGFA